MFCEHKYIQISKNFSARAKGARSKHKSIKTINFLKIINFENIFHKGTDFSKFTFGCLPELNQDPQWINFSYILSY